jgi:hypothetical protein
MATTKIKDLLKSIVNSPELYELFTTVTSSFDYLEAKRKYLVDVYDGVVNRSYVSLPETVGDRLAFIFCLLVEFDRDTINFNDFLQRYFSEDASYYASYHAFCDSIIFSLEQMIKDIYAKELAQSDENSIAQNQNVTDTNTVMPDGQKANYISIINLLIAQEKQFILESKIPDDDKEAGYKMLTEIINAVKSGNVDLINALVCGYNYYILYNNSISESVSTLFENIQQYEETL